MIEVRDLTETEYLREIAMARRIRVIPDSAFSGFKVVSLSGDLSYGHPDKLTALRDALATEPGVDLDFISKNLLSLTVREGDSIDSGTGNATIEEIFSRSGLIEGPLTRVNISQPGSNNLVTLSSTEVLDKFKLYSNPANNPVEGQLADLLLESKSNGDLPVKNERQFSFNF